MATIQESIEICSRNVATELIVGSRRGQRFEGGAEIERAMRNNTSIVSLGFASESISPEQIKLICNMFDTNKTVRTLKFSRNSLEAEGLEELAKSLKNNTSITELLLFGNRIKAEGAKHISKFIAGNKYITSLSLAKEFIGDEGLLELSDALSMLCVNFIHSAPHPYTLFIVRLQ